MADTVKVSATITAIDKATRDVTLKGQQGNLMTVTAGPEVKNFDKLKVGDQVDLQYIEALTLELKKGEMPGGAVGRQVIIVADVVAVESRESDRHAEGTESDSRPANCRSGAVQADRKGRPSRGEVHPGARRRGGASHEEVARDRYLTANWSGCGPPSSMQRLVYRRVPAAASIRLGSPGNTGGTKTGTWGSAGDSGSAQRLLRNRADRQMDKTGLATSPILTPAVFCQLRDTTKTTA